MKLSFPHILQLNMDDLWQEYFQFQRSVLFRFLGLYMSNLFFKVMTILLTIVSESIAGFQHNHHFSHYDLI